MNVSMDLNLKLPQLEAIGISLGQINIKLDKIIMTGSEALAAIKDIGDQITAATEELGKAQGEIVQKIADLEAALASANLSPEAEAALAELKAKAADAKAKAQALDDIVPDVLPPAA